MIRLIQGMFFQGSSWFGLGTRAEIGVVATVNSGMREFPFAGMVWPDHRNALGGLIGFIQDTFGDSFLSDIYIDERLVRFTKKYKSRSDAILYEFTQKHGNVWIGKYSGEAVGEGICWCVVTDVEPTFISPELIMQKLGQTAEHVWPKEEGV